MALSSNRPGNRILNPEIRVRSPEASPFFRRHGVMNAPAAQAAPNNQQVLVAEAADASGSDPVHCRFESCRGYQHTFVAELAYATD